MGHGTGAGGSQWRTTLWVHNPGSSPADCQLQILLRDQANPSPDTYNLTVQPGDTMKFDDATWYLFGIEGYGALRVVCNQEMVVNSRIYNKEGSDISDTQGQFFAGVPATFAIGMGESTQVLGINQAADGEFRYNFGMVETTGHDVTGNVILDSAGEAVVELPEWFEALNRDFRYQLTAIGGPIPNLYVAEKISDHRFRIAGGSPGLEVSWQVTGIRHDPWAEQHRIPVEVEKPDVERGLYIHPDLYGKPAEKNVEWATHPEAAPPEIRERLLHRTD